MPNDFPTAVFTNLHFPHLSQITCYRPNFHEAAGVRDISYKL